MQKDGHKIQDSDRWRYGSALILPIPLAYQIINLHLYASAPSIRPLLRKSRHLTTFVHALKHQGTDREAYTIRVSVPIHLAALPIKGVISFYKCVRLRKWYTYPSLTQV